MAFHRVLLAPYSRLPVMGVDEMGGGGAAVGLPSCFERVSARLCVWLPTCVLAYGGRAKGSTLCVLA